VKSRDRVIQHHITLSSQHHPPNVSRSGIDLWSSGMSDCYGLGAAMYAGAGSSAPLNKKMPALEKAPAPVA
jgi:hypothetical protein